MSEKTDVEAMKARVYELNRMSAAIEEERRDLEQKIAEAAAVWHVGQRVLWRERGEYEISRIGRNYGMAPRYFGRKILKGGKVSEHETELWGASYISAAATIGDRSGGEG